MKIFCKSCSREIDAECINLDRLIAKCYYCRTVFSFHDQIELNESTSKVNLDDIPIPKGLSIKRESGNLVIEQKWSRTVGLVMGIISIFWNGALWLGIIPSSLALGALIIALLSPFVIVGLGMVYVSLSNLLNTTKIRIDSRTLTVRHIPLPFKNKRLSVQDISQLYSRHQIYGGGSRSTGFYELMAVNYNNQELAILRNLNRPEIALYIEKEIEGYLAIHDTKIPGGI